MAYNVYKHPPRSDFERELREWNDSQPLNPSTYEDGTRITSGAGQVEVEKGGKIVVLSESDAMAIANVWEDRGAIGDEQVLELATLLSTYAEWWGDFVFNVRCVDDIRARVAEMRRLREEADKKKLAEAAILSHEELVEVATRQVRYTGVQPLPPSHSAEDILAAVVDDLCVPGDMLELADHLRETGEAST